MSSGFEILSPSTSTMMSPPSTMPSSVWILPACRRARQAGGAGARSCTHTPPGRGGAGRDVLHEHAARNGEVHGGSKVLVERVGRHAEVGVQDAAVLLELRDDALGGVDRHGKADADRAAGAVGGDDLRVDPDHLAGSVQQGPTRVAW